MLTRFVMAIQSLTRIHIRQLAWDEVNHGRSTAFFSTVGLLIGGILWAVAEIASNFYPPTIVAILLITTEIIITGGMHFDGFMDSMDGLFSGRSRERMLEIMRDSRVGAYGAMSAIILILLKYNLLLELPDSKLAILLLMPAFGRWAIVYAMKVFPYARPEGLGKAYQNYTTLTDVMFCFTIAALAAYFLLSFKGLIILGLISLFVHLLWSKVNKILGGLTGDIYGAIIETTEVLVLLLFYLF